MPDRLCLVEDNPDLQTLYTKRLTQAGYRVVAVCDAEHALAHLRADRIDVPLTEWHLPGRSGAELIQQSRHMLVMTIMMSTDSDIIRATRQCAFDGYYWKMAPFTQLVMLLHTLEREGA